MGDFNTCLIKDDWRASRLENIIKSANLNLLPTNATHFFPNTTPSQLDLMIVSSNERVATYGQLCAEAFSYHDLIYMAYKIRTPKIKPTIIMRRSFKNFNNEAFLQDLNKIDWESVLNAPTVNEKNIIFNSLLIELFDVYAPLRPIKLKHLPAPWLTEDIKTLMAKRNSAKSKYKRNPTEENLNRFKTLRNRCNKTCRDAQRTFIYNSMESCNSASVWKFLD